MTSKPVKCSSIRPFDRAVSTLSKPETAGPTSTKRGSNILRVKGHYVYESEFWTSAHAPRGAPGT